MLPSTFFKPLEMCGDLILLKSILLQILTSPKKLQTTTIVFSPSNGRLDGFKSRARISFPFLSSEPRIGSFVSSVHSVRSPRILWISENRDGFVTRVRSLGWRRRPYFWVTNLQNTQNTHKKQRSLSEGVLDESELWESGTTSIQLQILEDKLGEARPGIL